MAITIPEAVGLMLSIVDKLCSTYPKKEFTLDGRLVGDIGAHGSIAHSSDGRLDKSRIPKDPGDQKLRYSPVGLRVWMSIPGDQ